MPKSERVIVKDRVEENVCDLSLSELTEVPARQIASLKRVTQLDLSSNRLLNLGKNFIILTRLIKLDLSKNQIKFLPEDFGLLINLRHLDLYDNKLEHLPLSFGDLTNLRYLDLKGNPLTPALGKIVGLCLTTKECHDAARNTVRFLKDMQSEAEKAKAQHQQSLNELTNSEMTAQTNQKKQTIGDSNNEKAKKSNKKNKSKAKKSNNNIKAEQTAKKVINNEDAAKGDNVKVKKSSNATKKLQNAKAKNNQNTALTSILTFCGLLAVNIFIIYLIMFKNPEIAEKMVESIPQQYRQWLLSKTEFFRLRVTDWISQFQTPPDEH